jgi:anti-sigma B factor antagonist
VSGDLIDLLLDFALTTRTQDDGSTLVALAGELDMHRVPALADALHVAVGRVVVDLQEVTFLDSATLALLVHEHRRLQAAGQELTVLVGEQTPTTVFVITGIDRILTIRSAEAASHVPGSRAA